MVSDTKAESKEDKEIGTAVDKEVADLVFLHKSQRGKRINMDELRKEVAEIHHKTM